MSDEERLDLVAATLAAGALSSAQPSPDPAAAVRYFKQVRAQIIEHGGLKAGLSASEIRAEESAAALAKRLGRMG